MRPTAKRYMLLVLAIAGAAGSACNHAPADPADAAPARQAVAPPLSGAGPVRVPGQYLVTVAPGADAQVIAEVFGRFGIKSIQEVMAGVFLLTVGEDPGPGKMETLRKQNARIKAIQPNFVYGPAGLGAGAP